MAEIDLGRINLQKGDIIMGLSDGRALYISSQGDVSETGRRGLPDYAYLMFPLVARVVPAEFEGPGSFSDIVAMEEKLGQMFGSAEEVYEKVGPSLARDGVAAERLAKTFMEMSPIKVMKDTGEIGQDAYDVYVNGLTRVITEYYPGSVAGKRGRIKPGQTIVFDTGKHRSKDGVSF